MTTIDISVTFEAQADVRLHGGPSEVTYPGQRAAAPSVRRETQVVYDRSLVAPDLRRDLAFVVDRTLAAPAINRTLRAE